MISDQIAIRPEEHKDYRSIVSLILRSFREGTDYSDGFPPERDASADPEHTIQKDRNDCKSHRLPERSRRLFC